MQKFCNRTINRYQEQGYPGTRYLGARLDWITGTGRPLLSDWCKTPLQQTSQKIPSLEVKT